MAANKYLPHLLIIPEDDANRQLVNGFTKNLSIESRQIQTDKVAGGWSDALKAFVDVHVPLMREYKNRYVLILIDFDERENRMGKAQAVIPEDLAERVFVMGSWSEPEKLAAELNMSKEKVGEAMASACVDGGIGVWESDLLVHNQSELRRMQGCICCDLVVP